MSTGSGVVWQIDVEKAIGSETWTNVYYFRSADKAAAINAAGVIASIEQVVHNNDVVIERARIKARDETGNNGTIVQIGLQATGGPTTNMPLFVCARVVMNQVQGRPSVKYLRGGVTQSNIANRYNFTQAFLDFMASEYEAPLMALDGLCGNDGLPFDSIQTSPKIAEHQLRRGSKRKPVLG